MPPAPDGPVAAAWAVATAVIIFVLTLAFALLSPWLGIIPNAVMGLAALYLIGGELWNRRMDNVADRDD